MTDNIIEIGKAKRPRKRAAAPAIPEGWEADLRRTKKGDVKKTLANVVTILVMDPRWQGVIAYDAFGEAVVTTRPPPTRPQDTPATPRAGEWSEEDSIRTATWLSAEFEIDVATTMVDQAVATVGMRNVIHPVRDYLRSCARAWDGELRLERVLVTYFGAPDTAYVRGVGCRWMIPSAVARIERPGCQADCTLVLESPAQGTGKSTGLEALAGPEHFADTGITIGDKDSYQSLRRKWIYELGELTSVRGREVERVKNFLSARSDNYRPSYGRRNRDFPRQTVFAGTTNESQYLIDKTGNRRFWPVRTGRIDVAAIRRDRDQLWGEAATLFQRGEPWHVNTPEFASLCAEEQADRVHDDPWVEFIAAWLACPVVTMPDGDDGKWIRTTLDPKKGFTTGEVLVGALRKKTSEISRADEMRVAEALRDIGYTNVRRYQEGGERVRRYSQVGHGSPVGWPHEAPTAQAQNLPVQHGQPHSLCTQEKSPNALSTLSTGSTWPGRAVGHDVPQDDPEREAIQAEGRVLE